METITIVWGEQNSPQFSWYVDGNSSSGSSSSGQTKALPDLEQKVILKADLASLSSACKERKVVLVLACQDILHTQAALPPGAKKHIKKALPFLLEEEFAESVENMFLATEENSGDIVNVRAINRSYLEAIFQAFELAEIEIDFVCSQLDLIEKAETGYQVVLTDQLALVVDDKNHRWYCRIDQFMWLIQKQLDANDTEELPVAIPMQVYADDQKQIDMFNQQLPVGRFAAEAEKISSVEQRLNANYSKAINLLQGSYAKKTDNSDFKNLLIQLGTVAATVLVAYIFLLGSQLFQLNKHRHELREQRVAFWKTAFPDRRVPGNPDKELRIYLKQRGAVQDGNTFLTLLQKVTAEMGDLQAIYPTNISYDAARSEVRLDIVAKDLPALNRYRDQLKAKQYSVEMSSATQRGDGYSSRLIVRGQ